MLYRVIIQGNLDFGNEKSYEKAKKMYEYRLENYFKSDAIFKESNEIFFDDKFQLSIPRYVGQAFEKTFKNTASLLDYCAQFAMSGVVKCWQTDSGKVLNYSDLEPKSDKIAVKLYHKGKELSKEDGKEKEAFEELSKAISKYDKHAMAYERRGNVNRRLKKYSEAIRDFNKTIAIDDSNPMAYYGLARVYIVQEKYQEAIDQLEIACKKSLALQPIYWNSRRLKADCHLKLNQWDKAEFDLKLFSKRNFKETDSNYGYRRHAFYYYGRTLIELERYVDAISAFDSALSIEDGIDNIPVEDIYFYLGTAKKLGGKTGYTKDFKKATELGCTLEAVK